MSHPVSHAYRKHVGVSLVTGLEIVIFEPVTIPTIGAVAVSGTIYPEPEPAPELAREATLATLRRVIYPRSADA